METFLAIMGAVIGLGGLVYSVAHNQETKISNSKQTAINAYTGYQSSLDSANEYIRSAEDLYNQTKTEISNKYSADLFNLLEEQYNSINQIGNVAVSKHNLSQYEIEGDMNFTGDNFINRFGTWVSTYIGGKDNAGNLEESDSLKRFKERQFAKDYDYNYEKHGLHTNQYSSEVTDRFYNLLATGNSAIAQELQLSGLQIGNLLDQSYYNATQSLVSGALSLNGYSSQARQQSIQDAENVAQARSTMAYSGIRQTGTANANENLARLQEDLNRTAYAVQMKSVAMQLQANIHDLQTTSSVSAYEKKAQMEINKRNALEQATSGYSSGTNKAEEQLNNAHNEEENAQEHKKQFEKEITGNWYYGIEIE